MKSHTWLFLIIIICLILSACDSPAPTPPVVERTKPPFELPDRTQTIEAFQTQTLQAAATLQVLATATAAARLDEIMAYEYNETFEQNSFDWRDEVGENVFWEGRIDIQDGVYTWHVDVANDIFIAWSAFEQLEDLADFDLALSARRVVGDPNDACFGLIFRLSPDGFNAGMYTLTVCDDGRFKVLYYDGLQGWETIIAWTESETIQADAWNLIEISARGEVFTLMINHQQVAEFSDSRLSSGLVAIMIDIHGEAPIQIEFDAFALQPR